MIQFTTDYTVSCRWQWFSRARWQGNFRRWKKNSADRFVALVKELGLENQPVLDCSCGLGLKTILLKEAGLQVDGSDICDFAVQHASLLAREECSSPIHYFKSSWADLPKNAPHTYSALFNDALSWIYSDEEMASSLKGLHDVLSPKGVMVYLGALPGSEHEDTDILQKQWDRKITDSGKYTLGWHHSEGTISVTEASVLEKGPDYFDRHVLYIIDDNGQRRLEATTERNVCKWHWSRIKPLLREAGFIDFSTYEYRTPDGKTLHLVVARRD